MRRSLDEKFLHKMINITEDNIPLIPGPSREKWIPADRYMPLVSGNYLCVIEEMDELFGLEKNLAIGYFNPNSEKFQAYGKNGYPAKVILWIPIPEIPKNNIL